MKLKTTLLALVTVALLCGTFAFAAVANADFELSIESVSGAPGDTVTVAIYMDQNPGIYYLGLYLEYDQSALTLKSVNNESTMTFMSGIQQIWYSNGVDNYTDVGKLATVTFEINADAPDGEYTIGIMSDWAECYNADEDTVNISVSTGVAKICSHTRSTSVETAPTCTADGEIITYCEDCGIELSRDAIPALGHLPGDWVIVIEPTCTETGLQYQSCTRCDEILDKQEIPARGHVEGEWVTETEPTCTEDGIQYLHCAVCSEITDKAAIPAKGHVSGEWITQVEATCTAGGVKALLCSVCDAIVETAVTPVIPHNYDGGVITTAPTCAAEGVLTYTCTACDHSYTETIAKAPHTYDALGICSVCGGESAVYISATETKATIDDTFSVELSLDRNAGIFYLALIIDYDTDALELVSVENGTLFNLSSGQIFVWTATAENVISTGTLATLNFTVKETATADTTYPISVKVYECYDENESAVDAVAGSGSVFVYDYVYGDANGDGKVNGQDATRLLRYLANFNPATGESTLKVEGGADVNGDGKINGQDATRLLRYLANLNPATGESTVTLGPANK